MSATLAHLALSWYELSVDQRGPEARDPRYILPLSQQVQDCDGGMTGHSRKSRTKLVNFRLEKVQSVDTSDNFR